MNTGKASPWMKTALRLAAVYNIGFGLWAVFFPAMMFEWAGLAPPNYPELWQCIGMIVGVYGVGYWIAASNPLVHWPIVLVGFLGKLFGPIGFWKAAAAGTLPWTFGWINITNDLIWLAPFGMILNAAYRYQLERRISSSPEVQRMALRSQTQHGLSLHELTEISPTLLVFLRHIGCTFCREAVADLSARRREIEANGTRIALVHMSPEAEIAPFLARYQLDDVPRVSDPNCNLYRAFGLTRGNAGQLFGPKVWIRGFHAGVLEGHGAGRLRGDGFQMPGVFLMFHGEILRSYRHHSAADRPDYVSLTDTEQLVP
ncbi:MAG: redoxin domain-containing protein [Bryobacteraceae bacterium]|nr:redoxin domain-containing protein [Bryobacteraceae bacterium]